MKTPFGKLTIKFIFLSVCCLLGGAANGEPLGQYERWGLHKSLGVVFEYRVGHEDWYYAHPVLANGPIPECKGFVGLIEGCERFALRMGAIVLITEDERMPEVYIVQKEATHLAVNGGNFQTLTETSSEFTRD